MASLDSILKKEININLQYRVLMTLTKPTKADLKKIKALQKAMIEISNQKHQAVQDGLDNIINALSKK